MWRDRLIWVVALFLYALSHGTWLERMKGIEPSSEAWEATALPLSYIRLKEHHTTKDPVSKRDGAHVVRLIFFAN